MIYARSTFSMPEELYSPLSRIFAKFVCKSDFVLAIIGGSQRPSKSGEKPEWLAACHNSVVEQVIAEFTNGKRSRQDS